MPSRLEIALPDIVTLFDEIGSKIYTRNELGSILSEHRSFWRLAVRTTLGDFIDYLQRRGKLRLHAFQAENYAEKVTRYSWGEVTQYLLATSIRKNSYVTHGTAMFIHGITDINPKLIYINHEQSPKPSGGNLTQRGLDMAFAGKQRTSKLTFVDDQIKILVLNGKNTGRLEVESLIDPEGSKVQVTSLERTLVDIVVRPAYAGGIFQILNAYKEAKERTSINRISMILKKLDYVYPYHQAIGYLLERAGHSADRCEILQKMGLNFDFYLTHGMKEPEYDERWRLYFPKGL